MNECTSVAGHFDAHGEALKQYMRHFLMQHVQGYFGSHWMLPSGNYLLCIGRRPTRLKNVPNSLAVLMAIVMRWNNTKHIAQWRRFMAFIKATERCHRASTRFDSIQSDMPTPVVSYISSWKRARVDMLATNNNKGMTYQTNEQHLTNLREYFVGVGKLAIYCCKNCSLLRVVTNNLPKYLSNRVILPLRII